VNHGFHSWDTLLNIQEEDMEALNFKLGHRRKLQREIAVSKNIRQIQEQLDISADSSIIQDRGDMILPIYTVKRKRACEEASVTNEWYDHDNAIRLETNIE
jgi:hypothetical protein